jgi:O-glycosyl hydrolase
LLETNGLTLQGSGRLWAFTMWSRFIRPGAYRIVTTGSISNTMVGAFENTDGSYVAVFTNIGSSSRSVSLTFNGFTPKTVAGYLTDNTHNVSTTTVSHSGSTVNFTLPEYSVVTVKSS